MPPKMIEVKTDFVRLTKLKTRMSNYPRFAINEGLEVLENYMNTDEFLTGMYPPSQAGQPFTWSSEKQRRAFFATDGFGGGIPHVRTYELKEAGKFIADKKRSNLWIEYVTELSWAKFVIGQLTDIIIGHRKRGWQPITQLVVGKSAEIARTFEFGVKRAWNKMGKIV